MVEDAELVSRIRDGDLDAFEILYHKYKGQLYRTVLAITNDRGAAEEILQDCFLKAYHHIDRVNGCSSLSPWLHRIVVNLSYNWAAKRRLRLISLEDVLDGLLVASRNSPERAFEREELLRVVYDAVGALSMPHRVVIVLFYLQGFSLAEIAYVLDCPLGTVKSRLHNARRALKKKLTDDSRVSGEAAYELLSS
jgi:RNA polymerase sigma-70 factor (ECF subfamily)